MKISLLLHFPSNHPSFTHSLVGQSPTTSPFLRHRIVIVDSIKRFQHSFRTPSHTFRGTPSLAVEPDLQSFLKTHFQSIRNFKPTPLAMAVLKNLLLGASVLTSLVNAVPMLGPDKRAIYTNTVTEIAWVTVEETTTVWVDQADPTPAPQAAVVGTTTSSVPAVAVTGAYTPSTFATMAAAAPQAPPTSYPAAADYTSPAAPAPDAASSPAPAPAPAPASSAPAAPAPVPASSPAPAPAPMATPVNVQPKDTVGTDGSCEGSGDACQGDVTHWDGGLGACGWTVNTDSDYAIALPFAFMGTQSNGNPYCGRSVTLYNPTSGTTVQATVGDKCMGCVDRAIDCTDALFNAITDGTGDGRVSGIQWWLN